MRCPECETSNISRPKGGPRAWREVVEKEGKTWRIHECRNCGKMFVSVQMALSTKQARKWADSFEPVILPESGSTSTGNDTGASTDTDEHTAS